MCLSNVTRNYQTKSTVCSRTKYQLENLQIKLNIKRKYIFLSAALISSDILIDKPSNCKHQCITSSYMLEKALFYNIKNINIYVYVAFGGWQPYHLS